MYALKPVTNAVGHTSKPKNVQSGKLEFYHAEHTCGTHSILYSIFLGTG